MAQAVEKVSVHLLAKTTVERTNVRAWLDELGATEFVIPPKEQLADPALLVAIAAKQCYMSFQAGLNPNVNKVREDMLVYLDNILAQRHGSVLTHAVFSFGINNCSRVFTAEMNRHSVGTAISERSMRYVRMDNLSYWLPAIFRDEKSDSAETLRKKRVSRAIMAQAFKDQEDHLAALRHLWEEELAQTSGFHVKKVLTSAFRRIIGMGVCSGGVWSLNLRALRHVIAIRTGPEVEEEMVHIISQVGRIMFQQLPELFHDFTVQPDGAFVPEHFKV